MKKHFSIILAELTMVAMLLFACNEIDSVGFDVASAVGQQMVGEAHGIGVTQNEALYGKPTLWSGNIYPRNVFS